MKKHECMMVIVVVAVCTFQLLMILPLFGWSYDQNSAMIHSLPHSFSRATNKENQDNMIHDNLERQERPTMNVPFDINRNAVSSSSEKSSITATSSPSDYLFNATLDRTVYGSGSTVYLNGFLGDNNATPLSGHVINITLFNGLDQKITSFTTLTLNDGSWSANYQLSATIPSGGYYFNVSVQVASTRLSLRLSFTVVSQSPMEIISLSTYPSPPVAGFPTSVVVELSSSNVESVRVIFTLDNGTTWDQVSLQNSKDDPKIFSGIIGTFRSDTFIQWFVSIKDNDGRIKESDLRSMTFQSFQATFNVEAPTIPLTHSDYLINVSISTNVPDDYYYLTVVAQNETATLSLMPWKVAPHQFQMRFSTTREGSWTFVFAMHEAFNSSILTSLSKTLVFSLKDLHPPIISSFTYDETSILENQPVEVNIVITENQTYRDLQVILTYRRGRVETGFNTPWTNETLLHPGENNLITVSLTWQTPFVLKEGDLVQVQVVAIDGAGNEAKSNVITMDYPVSRQETSPLPIMSILIALPVMFVVKKTFRTPYRKEPR